MHLIDCEINLILNWSANYVIVCTNNAKQAAIFTTPDTKPYVLIVTLSNQDNAKLLEQFKPGFNSNLGELLRVSFSGGGGKTPLPV